MSDQLIKTEDPKASLYEAAVQHWSHAEQIRWTLLYNYLMASTILLLAWATVFASALPGAISWPKRFALVTLPIGGLVLSVLWIALGLRASSFVEMYTRVGRALEPKSDSESKSEADGPFVSASNHREVLSGVASWATSRRVLVLVPLLFVCIYGILVGISISER